MWRTWLHPGWGLTSEVTMADRPSPALDRKLALATWFDQVSREQWQELAESTLKGRPVASLVSETVEGISRQPLYTASDTEVAGAFPGQPPFTRGNKPLAGWESCRQVTGPEPGLAVEQTANGQARGAAAIWLTASRSCHVGRESDGNSDDVMMLTGAAELEPVMAGLDRQHPQIHLSPGGNLIGMTAAVVAALQQCGIDPGKLTGSLGGDPLGALAGDGELPASIDTCLVQLAEVSVWSMASAPGLRSIAIDSTPYHMAGATAVQELAITVATGVEYLRCLEDRIGLAAAFDQLGAVVSIGRDLFVEIAKLRALRRLWSHLQQTCSVDQVKPIPIHAVTSLRTMTARDPWSNLLRGTAQTFAAAVGGAETVTTLPFDSALGPPSRLAQRLAVNTQTILREESHLARVADPAGGSWYVEQMTRELAERAWSLVQSIEAGGGMRSCLLGGEVAKMLGETLELRRQAIARFDEPITGVSSYPLLDEQLPESTPRSSGRPSVTATTGIDLEKLQAVEPGTGKLLQAAIDAAADGASVLEITTAAIGDEDPTCLTPLIQEREAVGFEALRDAGDLHLQATGSRPTIFLAVVGSLQEQRPRLTFAESFLAAGGLATAGRDGHETAVDAVEEFSKSGACCAVVCSSDGRYPEVVPQLAAALKAAGARQVVVAGRPGEHEAAWRDAGVDQFIFIGCDMLKILSSLHESAGVGQ
jgi:methylmalonyl-CoA mutase